MKTYDHTTTWTDIIEEMLDLIQNRSSHLIEERKLVIEEFKRMAKAADEWNKHVNQIKQ